MKRPDQPRESSQLASPPDQMQGALGVSAGENEVEQVLAYLASSYAIRAEWVDKREFSARAHGVNPLWLSDRLHS